MSSPTNLHEMDLAIQAALFNAARDPDAAVSKVNQAHRIAYLAGMRDAAQIAFGMQIAGKRFPDVEIRQCAADLEREMREIGAHLTCPDCNGTGFCYYGPEKHWAEPRNFEPCRTCDKFFTSADPRNQSDKLILKK